MKWFLRGSLVALAVSTAVTLSAARATDDPKKTDPPKTAKTEQKADDKKADEKKDPTEAALEKYREAQKKLQEAEKAFQAVLKEAQEKGKKLSLEDPDIRKAYETQMADAVKVSEAALVIGKLDPKSKDGTDALLYVAQRSQPGSKPAKEAISLLIKHHIDRDEISRLVMNMSRMPYNADTAHTLSTIEEKSTNKTNVLAAKVVRGKMMLKDKDTAKEGEALLEKILAESKSEKLLGQPIGKMLEGDLFEYRFLANGKPVPEIEGEDVDGKSFKISDYKGKVVMLDFWGHW